MKIKLNYILIAVIAILTILCGYLLIDKFVLSTSKTIVCKHFEDEDTFDFEVIETLKVNSVGKIVNHKMEVISTYDKESDYLGVKEAYSKKENSNAKFNDKKLRITDVQQDGKFVDDDGKEMDVWDYTYVKSLKETGYKCK